MSAVPTFSILTWSLSLVIVTMVKQLKHVFIFQSQYITRWWLSEKRNQQLSFDQDLPLKFMVEGEEWIKTINNQTFLNNLQWSIHLAHSIQFSYFFFHNLFNYPLSDDLIRANFLIVVGVQLEKRRELLGFAFDVIASIIFFFCYKLILMILLTNQISFQLNSIWNISFYLGRISRHK